ncbi:MAG: ribonuclease [Rhodobacteraceae bacterium]|nr:ribonuclease [Paracoccaceae bacterium]
MAKKMLIDATHAEETRVVVVDGNKVEEFDFESENKRQLAGNIYLAKVTRVEPSLQAAFVDYGGNRHGFLAFAEIHPDYYQIPVADREALMEEERAYAEAQRARDEEEDKKKSSRSKPSSSSRSRTKAARAKSDDPVETREVDSGKISGMETIDLGEDDEDNSDVTTKTPDTDTDAVTGDTPAETAEVEESTAEDNGAQDAASDEAGSQEAGSDDDSPDDEASDDASDDEADDSDGDDDGDDDEPSHDDASARDDTIETVAEEDDSEDIRPARKPRPRRYKIQEVIKVRQILLVQVVKEERGNKGAALTTYLSLAGRYCVLMPNTARGGGISRKITNAVDRKKLKEIAAEIDVPKGAGLIVRTAGAKRTKSEIKRDYEYLQRLWEQIRELTLKSIAPAKIYEEGDLIKRSIRDLYSREIDEVIVEGDRGYRIAKDFMKMIMPSHAKNVKRYEENMPLFARHQVESYLAGMFNPTVQLKSGGYIVIGVTEALVAIDVNSGRATKEGSIEETALKTNLEAAEEVARQLRLRDLAGLIVIDFIDMDERKNNASVEKRMKDRLKTDRARIQVGRISGFGLMEMSRQRLRPGMIEATTQPCPACHGTGLIRSDDNMALSILRQIEEEGVRRRSREVLVKCPVGIANFLINQKREHIAQIEQRYGLSVRLEGDPHLISPDFSMERFKTATRTVPVATTAVVSADSSIMDMIDAEEEDVVVEEEEVEEKAEAPEAPEAREETDEESPKPKRRRRRRRRRSGNKANGDENGSDENGEGNGDDASSDDDAPDKAKPDADAKPAEAPDQDAAPVDAAPAEVTEDAPVAEAAPEAPAEETAEQPVEAEPAVAEVPAEEEAPAETVAEAGPEPVSAPEPEVAEAPAEPVAAEAESAAVAEAAPEAPEEAPAPVEETPAEEAPVEEAAVEEAPEEVEETPAEASEEASTETTETKTPAEPEPFATAEPEPEAEPKPKRRGWWSMGS